MATSGNGNVQQYLRVSDVAEEPLKMLMPICGFEEMPLVSLEEAVEPLLSILPNVQDYVHAAKQRCEPIPADGLTQDESASIMLYTMNWEPREECLYYVLNATLRSEDREQLKPWFSYLKLFLTALAQIPCSRRAVHRGIKLDLSKNYPKGKEFVWWGFASCTSSVEALKSEQFVGKTGERTLFSIDCASCKDISRHSYFQSEVEILLPAARQFVVTFCSEVADGLHMIRLKETKSPVTLIPIVTNDSSPSSESQEFATPGTYKRELRCGGRRCARCGQCRDWYFTGNAATLDRLRTNKKCGTSDNYDYWVNNRLWNLFKPRNDMTCGFHTYPHGHYCIDIPVAFSELDDHSYGLDPACFCEDNVHN